MTPINPHNKRRLRINVITYISREVKRITSCTTTIRIIRHNRWDVIINDITYILLSGIIPKIGCIICRNNIMQHFSCIINCNCVLKVISTRRSHRNIRMTARTIPIFNPYSIKTRAVSDTSIKRKTITSIRRTNSIVCYLRHNVTNNIKESINPEILIHWRRNINPSLRICVTTLG